MSAGAVARRLVIESAATVAACVPLWLRTRCSKLRQNPISAVIIAWRLVVESAAAAALRELIWLHTRCSKPILKPISAITFAFAARRQERRHCSRVRPRLAPHALLKV